MQLPGYKFRIRQTKETSPPPARSPILFRFQRRETSTVLHA